MLESRTGEICISSEEDREAVSLLLNWFKQLAVHGRIKPEDYESLEYIYRE